MRQKNTHRVHIKKQGAADPSVAEALRKLPKIDLHLHLDGAARPATLLELMRASGARLPTEDPQEFEKYVRVPRGCRSLAEFLRVFDFFLPILKSPEAVERLAYELCQDGSQQNVRYFEARFAPALLARDGFSQEDVVRAALRGLERGRKDFSVIARLILCFYRSITEEENRETLRLAESYLGRGVVGIDLAGDEARYPVGLYGPFFKRAAERGIPITCHAGEAAGPESVRNALELGARRIGHGVRLQEDSSLMERVRAEGVALEVCITSNVQTQAVRGYAAHPVKRFVEAGLRVTLNSDDPGVMGIDLCHEYQVALEKMGLTRQELERTILNSVESLFHPDAEVKALQEELRSFFRNGQGRAA